MKIFNRHFSREYEAVDKYEAGVVLTGAEVKSVKSGGMRLDNSYVKIIGSQAFLINAEITAYQYAPKINYEPRRTRKLLLTKKELLTLRVKLSSGAGLTIIPVSCYNKGALVKLEIALAKGRKDFEKRKHEKAKDMKREGEKEVKEYFR